MSDAFYPWVEKYRPQTLDDVIINPEYLAKFKEFEATKSCQHLLFEGGPGVGKTTIAKILAKAIAGEDNYLYINASDKNNIDAIRTNVMDYCGSSGFTDDLKIIILDECDGLTPVAQRALRAVMEEYAKKTRFIMTCNYGNKIIDALRSRCAIFEFEAASKNDIAKRCFKIMHNEGVTNFKEAKADLVQLVTKYYPDIRAVINNIQKNTKEGIFKFNPETATSDYNSTFIKLLAEKKFKEIRSEFLSPTTDYQSLYKTIFDSLRGEELTKNPTQKGDIYLLVADYQYKSALVLDQEINFIAMIVAIIRNLQ